MLSKQTALYSLQRKLKAARQAVQSKELHMSLLQKKVEGLEQSLRAGSRRETEWEANINKVTMWEGRRAYYSCVCISKPDEESREAVGTIGGEGTTTTRDHMPAGSR